MSKKLSTAFLVLAGALWGCLSIFVSALSDYGFDSKEIGFIRISLCTLMLLVIILIRDRSLLRVQLRDMCPLRTRIRAPPLWLPSALCAQYPPPCGGGR